MLLFNNENNEQKQKKRKAEKILNDKVGGLIPTSARMKFFRQMANKGIKATQQEKVRNKVLKTIKKEVINNELEPTEEAIEQRIEQILNENSAPLQQKIEEKYNIELTNKHWFKCTIEEVRYGTITNLPQRKVMDAYVIIHEDNFEILKEGMIIKSNMGSRKIYFQNITSLDFDARGKFNVSSSIVINTKSNEHIILKYVEEHVDEMTSAYNSYIENTHKIQENNTTNNADELLKYAELYEKGFLTEEEFNMKKEELLKKH